MTFGQFSQANRERCESSQGFNHPLGGWSTSDWMTALVGEIGEAANVVKKLNRVRDGVPGNKVPAAALRDQLRRELGDVFVYLDLMAQSLGFSIADAAVEVFNVKSAAIGYKKPLTEVTDEIERLSAKWIEETRENDRLRAAVRWALGEEADKDGQWFGESRPEPSKGQQRPWWWRKRLRELAFGHDSAIISNQPKE
jgi:NTP pyrophosphatase (non-canonical NTP hydrolase)